MPARADGALEDGLVQVVAAALAGRGDRCSGASRGRPTARATRGRRRVLAREGVGELDQARPLGEVDLVLGAHCDRCALRGARSDAGSRVTRSLRPLPSRTRISLPLEVDVLDAQAQHSSRRRPLRRAASASASGRPPSPRARLATSARVRTTGKRSGRLARTTFSSQPSFRSRTLHTGRATPRGPGFASRRSRAARSRGRSGSARCRPRRARRVTLPVKEMNLPDPVDVGFLGARAVVARPQNSPHAIEQPWRAVADTRPVWPSAGRGNGIMEH